MNEIFKNTKVNFEKLIKYGFCKENNLYNYSKNILENQFLLKVTVDCNGNVLTQIIDINSDEEYILHLLKDSTGEFVGSVRKEYEKILTDIKEKCFERNIFKSLQTQTVIEYIKNKYNDELEFLWDKFPNNAIFRRKDNKKWYAVLLTIPLNKLKIKSNEIVEIIDIKASEEQINELIDNKTVYEGYHMNKKHWITVVLNGSIQNEKLFELIDKSYQLANKN